MSGPRGLLFLPVAAASTLFFSLAAVLGGLVGARPGWFDRVHRGWARSLLRTAGVRVRAHGIERLERGRAYIFVCNHQSLFDIWALMASLPASLRFVAKRELARVPLFARACRTAGHVFIDRAKPAAAATAIRASTERMHREGLSLVLFPEGTRSPEGRLGRFKRGSFTLAIETGAALVPVAVRGGRHILPPGRLAPRSGSMEVSCGPPVPLERLGAEDRDRLLAETRAAIAAMLEAGGDGPPTTEPTELAEPTEPARGRRMP